MRKLALLTAMPLAALSFTGAAQAATCAVDSGIQYCFFVAGLDPEFTVSFNPDGTISAEIGREGIQASGATGTNFVDRYFFFTEEDGLGSGGVLTTASALMDPTNTDFTDVDVFTGATFNDVTVPYVPPTNPLGTISGGTNYDLDITTQLGGLVEFSSGVGIPITAFEQNYIQIAGFSRGNGSYGGNVTFTPTAAVPEPATWAMMLLGFGAIGFGMRRRRKEPTRVRFAF